MLFREHEIVLLKIMEVEVFIELHNAIHFAPTFCATENYSHTETKLEIGSFCPSVVPTTVQ